MCDEVGLYMDYYPQKEEERVSSTVKCWTMYSIEGQYKREAR